MSHVPVCVLPVLHEGMRTPDSQALEHEDPAGSQTPALEVLAAHGSEDDSAQSDTKNAEFQSHSEHLISAVRLPQPLLAPAEPASSAGERTMVVQLAGRQGGASQPMHDAASSPVMEHHGVTMQVHAYPQNALCML